jgi:hypothetical protein
LPICLVSLLCLGRPGMVGGVGARHE